MPKGDKPTLKERGFVRDYIATGNATEAARRNYDVADPTSSTPRSIGSQKLAKLGEIIEREAGKEGLSWLTPEYILTGINNIAQDPKAPYRAKISALELLGKSLALFTDKIETKNQILAIVGELSAEWKEEKPAQNGVLSHKSASATGEPAGGETPFVDEGVR